MPPKPPDHVPRSAHNEADFKPCPICRKPATAEARPFCSKRCADIDLHRWLGGVYAFPIPDDEAGLSEADDELS